MRYLTSLTVLLWVHTLVLAAPVSRERARLLAENWLDSNREALEQEFTADETEVAGEQATEDEAATADEKDAKKPDKDAKAKPKPKRTVFRLRAFRDRSQGVSPLLAHIVDLKPRGYMVVAADDRITPIIAFSTNCNYDQDTNRDFPLTDFLLKDLPQRLRVASQRSAAYRQQVAGRWTRLTAGPGAPGAPAPPGAIKVEAGPLVKTQWGQGGSTPTYNKFTPKQYITGCVATAMGQIMKYFEYPAAAKGTGTVKVDGASQSVSFDSKYDWDNMPQKLTSGSSVTQIDAVARLLADCGTMVSMQYTAASSGAFPYDMPPALTNTFGYESASHKYSTDADFYPVTQAELKAGYPMALWIYQYPGTTYNHEVVLDGYGTDAGTDYYHLNMGWDGAGDSWYTLPRFTDTALNVTWDTVVSIVYNIRIPAAGPDLVIDSLDVSPATGLVTDQRTVTCVVKNRGSDKANAFGVGLWTHRDKAPAAGTTGYHKSWRVSSLDPMQTTTLTHTFTPSSGGAFKAWAVADNRRQVTESKESNNVGGPVAWSADEANLTVTKTTLSPATGDTATQRTVTVTVKNEGTLDTAAFNVDFWLHQASAPKPGPTVQGDYTWKITNGLKKGASTTLTYAFTPTQAGSFIGRVLADSQGAVAETSEKDNAASVSWSATLPKVDLTITQVVVDPRTGVTTTPRTVTVTIKNTGSDPARAPFNVDFWTSRSTAPTPGAGVKGDQTWTVTSDLAGRASQTFSYTFTPTTDGYFAAYAAVDTTTTVAESLETNNVRAVSWSATKPKQGPDLRVINLTVTPSADEIGASRTLDITLANEGTVDAANFRFDVWEHRNTSPAVGVGVTGDQSWTGLSLAAGASAKFSHAFTSPAKGAYKAWALADTWNAVAEHTESNNAKSAQYTTHLPTRDLRIESLKIVPSAGTIETKRKAVLTIRNHGVSPAGAFTIAFWRNAVAEPKDSAGADTTWRVNGLAAGEGASLEYSFLPPSAGFFSAWAVLDTGSEVPEEIESNNAAFCPWLAAGTNGDPDLAVTKLTVTPVDAVVGKTRTAEISITNQGGKAATMVLNGFWQHSVTAPDDPNKCDKVWAGKTILPGQTKTISYHFCPAKAGSFTAWAFTDVTDCLTESDETNNRVSTTWTATPQPAQSAPPGTKT